jgi:hypothetical protein
MYILKTNIIKKSVKKCKRGEIILIYTLWKKQLKLANKLTKF